MKLSTGSTYLPRLRWLANGLALSALSTFAQPAATEPATASAKSQDDETIVLSPFVVSTGSEEGYYSPQSVAATRTRTELINLPLNLTVFNENFINDIGARDLVDIVSFASGVSGAATASSDNAGGDTLGFKFRGQDGFVPNRNGVRRLREVDPVTIARVEVIKGPNSLLYGPASPGGGVNYITKRPVQRKILTSNVQVGSFEFYKASVDANVPTLNNNLAVRFVGSYEDSQTPRDREHIKKKVLYPSATWWIRPETTLTVEFEETHKDRLPASQLPQHMLVDPQIPGNFGLVDETFNTRGPHDYADVEMTAFTVEFIHKFSENWRMRLNWADVSWEDTTKNTGPAALNLVGTPTNGGGAARQGSFWGVPANPRLLPGRSYSYGDRGSWDKYRTAEVFNNFEWHGVEVQNLFGYQLGQEKFSSLLSVTGAAADANRWNLSDPSTWIPSERFDRTLAVNSNSKGWARNTMNSGYFVNQLAFFHDRFHTLVGARSDALKGDNVGNVSNPDGSLKPESQWTTSYSKSKTRISPEYGVLYKLFPGVSFFANYSTSIVNLYTTLSRRSDGTYFVPVPGTGEGYDFGVKTDMLKGKLSSVISVFQDEETNIVRTLPSVTVNGETFNPSEQSGVNRSEGVELDITARPVKKTQVQFSYAYTYAYVKSDVAAVATINGVEYPTRTGRQLAYSPLNQVKGFIRQDLGAFGPFKNTYATFAGRWYDSRAFNDTLFRAVTSSSDPGVLTAAWRLRPYATFDLGFGAQFQAFHRKCTAQFIVKNLFDEHYLETRNWYGNPRNYMLTVRTEF